MRVRLTLTLFVVAWGCSPPPMENASPTATVTSGAGGGQGGGGGASTTATSTSASSSTGGGSQPDPETPCVPTEGLIAPTPPPGVHEIGLYDDPALKTIAAGVAAYVPRFPLWSDGSDKDRYVRLPEDCAIGTADMDDWVFPVGTWLYKGFVVEGELVETRVFHRYGTEPNDVWFATYQWNATGDAAQHVPAGVVDAHPTGHDIPSETDCGSCHLGVASRVLGFSAFQLSHDGPGLTMASLSTMGRITLPAPSGFDPPGDATAQAALGYLHANCGNCHNPNLQPMAHFSANLRTTDASIEQTLLFITAVGKGPSLPLQPGLSARIEPGNAQASAMVAWMNARGISIQMPPLGTEQVDDTGVGIVTAWIEALSP